jgi:hypothetical protein
MTATNQELRDEFERFARRIHSAQKWIGGDTSVALNSLAALAAEMIAHAESNGSVRDWQKDLEDARGRCQRFIQEQGRVVCSQCGRNWDTLDPCALCNATRAGIGRV